jgi:glycerol-3-phosphate dehydrogenase (NAD(P)+)
MVAEGYNASKCITVINKNLGIDLPIIDGVYKILWEGYNPTLAFKEIEKLLF